MIELEKIALKNIVVHKDTSIELEPGITVIRGDNGSGKSLLFNTLPNVFDGAVPLSKKKDAKGIHTSDESAIGIKYKFNNKQYRVVQKNKKGSLSYDIEEDGNNLNPRTVSIAKEMLDNIFPISNAQYYSLVHITSYRPSVLLYGTGPQRKEFFEELFHLNISEYVLDKIKDKFNNLKRSRDEKEILTEQLNELTYIDNIEELENKLDKVNLKYNQLNTQYLEYTKDIQKLTSIATYKSQLKTSFNLKELEEKIIDFSNKIEILEEKIQKFRVDQSLYENNQSLIIKKQKLQDALKEFDKYKDYGKTSAQIREEYQNLKDDRIKIQVQIFKAKEQLVDLERFKKLDSSINDKYRDMTLEKYLAYIGKIEGTITEKEAIIKSLESLDGEKICPTCQQILNEDSIKSLLGSLNNDLLYLGMEVQEKAKVIEWIKLKAQDLEEIDIKSLESKELVIVDKLRVLKSIFEDLQKKEQLELELKSIPEIIQVEVPDLQELNSMLDKVQKGKSKLNVLESDRRIQKELAKLNDDFKDLSLEELNNRANDLSPKIEQLNSIRSELRSKIEIGKSQNDIYQKKLDRIKEIEEDLLDYPIYEALTKAYGAKGIKIDQIRYLADAFCANLNKYTNLVFNKKVKFFVNVDSTNFNILAERNDKPAADVSTFSGAESRCFCLLCLLSLLPFIPEKYRTDFVILDELEAGIQESGRQLLTQGFFKVLQNLVSKIIIITPMSSQEYYIECNREYFLSLENNSTVITKVR